MDRSSRVIILVVILLAIVLEVVVFVEIVNRLERIESRMLHLNYIEHRLSEGDEGAKKVIEDWKAMKDGKL